MLQQRKNYRTSSKMIGNFGKCWYFLVVAVVLAENATYVLQELMKVTTCIWWKWQIPCTSAPYPWYYAPVNVNPPQPRTMRGIGFCWQWKLSSVPAIGARFLGKQEKGLHHCPLFCAQRNVVLYCPRTRGSDGETDPSPRAAGQLRKENRSFCPALPRIVPGWGGGGGD